MTGIVEYEFRQQGVADYEMSMTYPINNNLMTHIFNKSKEKLKKKHNIDVPDKMNDVHSFKVDPKFFNLLKSAIRKNLKIAEMQLKADKIHISTYKVKDAEYKRCNNNWVANIIIGGLFIDKR